MESRTFCFDIDGVIMTLVPDNDYRQAKPIPEAVDLINQLYRRGHRIIIFTARGYVTGKDWTQLTRSQLDECGLRYHQLLFGKPAADYYIDDRMIGLDGIRQMLKNESGEEL